MIGMRYESLLPAHEPSGLAVAEPLKTVRPGDKVQAKVLRVDSKRQRIGLSLRQAQEGAAPEE